MHSPAGTCAVTFPRAFIEDPGKFTITKSENLGTKAASTTRLHCHGDGRERANSCEMYNILCRMLKFVSNNSDLSIVKQTRFHIEEINGAQSSNFEFQIRHSN